MKDKFEHCLSREAREETLDAVNEHRERNARELRLKVIPPQPAPEPPRAEAPPERRGNTPATPPVQVLSASIGALAPELAAARDVTPLSFAGKLRKRGNRFGEEIVLLYYRFYFLSTKAKRWVVGSALLAMVFVGYGLAARAQRRAHLAAKHSSAATLPKLHAATPPKLHAAPPVIEKRRPATSSHRRAHHGKAAKKKRKRARR